MGRLATVTRGPHTLCARPLPAIDPDRAPYAELDAGVGRELAVRLDTDAEIHFLPKPFSLKQLATKVKEVMSGG